DYSYAAHFRKYKGLLSKLLKHDPEMFKLSKNAIIVDVGCGYGNLLKTLKERGYKKLIGVEPDSICRNACLKDGLDVREGTISNTNLPSSYADVVIVNQVFHHISNFE
ncbi:class I SAM-dependent methyltransferase, partial [Staphylococcus aureus]